MFVLGRESRFEPSAGGAVQLCDLTTREDLYRPIGLVL
jgi:hypothetical protein